MSVEYVIITDVDNPLCGLTYEEVIRAVEKNGLALQYLQQQTPEICLAAVKQNGLTLYLVEHQTSEICLAAVKESGLALSYVKDQTPQICLEAVKQSGIALHYVQHQTPELCLEAVKQNGYSLRYVKVQTPELCLEAVKRDIDALGYVKKSHLEYVETILGLKNLAVHDEYALIYEKNAYRAGCRGPWTREEALNHWNENRPDKERATLFRNAILNNVESKL